MATLRRRPSACSTGSSGILDELGLGMGDVVKMQVFLVHNAAAPMDFKAFMEGYTQFSAAASRICRRDPWSASPHSPIPAFWSRSRWWR